MASPKLYALFVFLLSLFSRHSASDDSSSCFLGMNYGRIADNLPSPSKVVELLKSQGIRRVKLYDTDSEVLAALSGSGITTTVALPNDQLSSAAAADRTFTDSWVRSNVVPYKSIIEAVAVGNEVFVDPANTTSYLVPAMRNVYASLARYGVASSVKVSSPIALSALATSYPPSSGSFKPGLVDPVMKPMLGFLKQTGSYLMVNAYPFFAYEANADTISLDYALFRDNQGVVDPSNGIVYKSLLDAQLDAVYSAASAAGFGDVKLVVSETGWPSKGDEGETGASAANAQAYNGNLVRRVLTCRGTPLRPDMPLSVYLFALFNEDQKPGPTSERNYGLFYPNEDKVYSIPLGLESGPVNNGSKVQVVPPAAAGQTWCVARADVGRERLQAALDYACGEGGADCTEIQPEAACYYPNTIDAHASYAFNSYYQKNSRASGTCHFDGAAYVVTQTPKFGSCEYPTGN